jgi:hypothetical protein
MKSIPRLTSLLLPIALLFLCTTLALGQNKPSEQKTGSVLVFPYYTSNDNSSADTQMSISNTGTIGVTVHLYFMEGRSCTQQDAPYYLTPNATLTMTASTWVPMETGYLIVVAVRDDGCLMPNAGLTGNAFVKAPAGYFGSSSGEVRGNYAATAFNAYRAVCPENNELLLNFNGTVLDMMPVGFAVAIQSPTTAPGQTIVMAGLNGTVTHGSLTGAAQVGSGGAYNEDEIFRSYSSFIRGGCQATGTISNVVPRISGFGTLGMSGLIKPGTVGILKYLTTGGIGILITPSNNAGWSGIRGLTCTRVGSVTLSVPVF